MQFALSSALLAFSHPFLTQQVTDGCPFSRRPHLAYASLVSGLKTRLRKPRLESELAYASLNSGVTLPLASPHLTYASINSAAPPCIRQPWVRPHFVYASLSSGLTSPTQASAPASPCQGKPRRRPHLSYAIQPPLRLTSPTPASYPASRRPRPHLTTSRDPPCLRWPCLGPHLFLTQPRL